MMSSSAALYFLPIMAPFFSLLPTFYKYDTLLAYIAYLTQ